MKTRARRLIKSLTTGAIAVAMAGGFLPASFADEILNDAYLHCGDRSSASMETTVDLARFQDQVMRKPSWVFSYTTRTPQESGKLPILNTESCIVSDIKQIADGYVFSGDDCSVTVMKPELTGLAVTYEDKSALSGCELDLPLAQLLKDFGTDNAK